MFKNFIDKFFKRHFFNDKYCYECGEQYKSNSNRHKCEFCGKYYCSDHVDYKEHGIDCAIKANERYCWRCGKVYVSPADKFPCRYCGRIFCTNHHLPENHFCAGNPRRPPSSFREIHPKGGKIIATGK